MKIAITTPTGHVGGFVTDYLLDTGNEIVLLGRRPQNLQKFVDRGARFDIGSLDDVDYVIRATRAADALLWVTPPGYGSDDVRSYQNRLGRTGAEAIRANRIPRTVNLSSIGAQMASGVGVVNGLHDIEELLDGAAKNITHLRAGFFFENFLMQADLIRNWGLISLPINGSQRCPMVACRDIGRAAADLLLNETWIGHRIRELHGPADLSFDEAAAALSEGLGRKVDYVRCEPEQARQAILDHGMSEDFARLLLELYEAIDKGTLMTTQERSVKTTTQTTLAEFARESLLPLMAEPVTR
jgi:uncharacterized protein YbjT (DUF2867 family)